MRTLAILATLAAACTVTTRPPNPPDPQLPPCENAQDDWKQLEAHAWEDFHLAHDALSPVIRNESGYAPDLDGWNALGTRIQLRNSGSGFVLRVVEGGDAASTWLGLASIRVDLDSHLAEATVTMNRVLLERYPEVAAAHVLCQELGHLLGLGHQPNTEIDSCMNDCAQLRGAEWLACLTDPAGLTPNAHDGEQLRAIYAHVPDDPAAPPCHPPTCRGQLVVHAFPLEGADHAH